MASYFDELHVEEEEEPERIHRLTRETFRMLFNYDPTRFSEINIENIPPASKEEIEKLKAPLIDKLIMQGI